MQASQGSFPFLAETVSLPFALLVRRWVGCLTAVSPGALLVCFQSGERPWEFYSPPEDRPLVSLIERGSSTAVPLHPKGKVCHLSIKQHIQMNKRCEQVWPTLCSAVRLMWLNFCLRFGENKLLTIYSLFLSPCSASPFPSSSNLARSQSEYLQP